MLEVVSGLKSTLVKVNKPQPPAQLEARPRSEPGSDELLSLSRDFDPIGNGMLLEARCGRASWALCSNGTNNELIDEGVDLCGECWITRVV